SFGFRKRAQSGGTVQIGHLTDEPGKFGFDVEDPIEFSPVFLKADKNLQAEMPDYRSQMTWDTAVTGPGAEVAQDPPPGAILGLGDHQVTMTLTTADGKISVLGFIVSVVAAKAPILTVDAPKASVASLSSLAPYTVKGTIRPGDQGSGNVRIIHN